MTSQPPARRLLLVHAHPDDETINTGATMAYYAATGAQVTLVTCTLGEEGEILVPSLAMLEADQADQLGGLRIGELAAAMATLGVTDHRFLGGAGRFRDSGMIGTRANAKARAFWRADTDSAVFDAAVDALCLVIRQVRPQVVITYDDVGGYGHPDHIMAHRITTEAVRRCATEPSEAGRPHWSVAKFYWTATLKPDTAEGAITTAIDARDFDAVKLAALGCHATQVTVDGDSFALSNGITQSGSGLEHFRLVAGPLGRHRDENGFETDLFDGVEGP